MLKELYDYSLSRGLAVTPGFSKRTINAYISLDKDGNLLGIVPTPKDKKVVAPDLGSDANGTKKCHIIVSKAEYVLGIGEGNTLVKHEFYKETLKAASEFEPTFKVVCDALEDDVRLDEMRKALVDNKVKSSAVIGFMVDGKPIESCTGYHEWWQEYRKQMSDNKKDSKVCMITGVSSVPVKIVPKVKGLNLVGGHSSGDSLICFDKDAFCSYGFDQADNASVSEDAISAVNAALNELIEKAPIHAKTRLVHWFKEEIPEDPFSMLDLDLSLSDDSDSGDDSGDDSGNAPVKKSEIRELYRSIRNGERPNKPDNIYYILPLSGNNGRVMVRGFESGRCEELWQNIGIWYDDLELVRVGGGLVGSPKLFRIYTRLVKYTSKKAEIGKKISEELSGLDNVIMRAIVNNKPLPDMVATRALAYIRSDIYADSERNQMKHPDNVCCQILKLWLIRRGRNMGICVNENYDSAAYHMGRLFAVYAKIQESSSPGVNAGVVERYYAAISTRPAYVLGKLAQLSNYHLDKLEKGKAIYYSKMLNDVSVRITPPIPASFSVTEQAEFALGYYHQCASFPPTKDKTNNDNE